MTQMAQVEAGMGLKRSLMQEAHLTLHEEDVQDMEDSDRIRFWMGLGLAVSSTIFIGSSFIVKKLALRGLASSGQTRAGAGGFGYLKHWVWWLGLITLGLGEAFNFAAYALVAASLVTPLGALSVLVSALLASRFLDEQVNLIGKIGCSLCLLGSTVIVIHAPTEGEVDTLDQLSLMLFEYEFLLYITFAILTTFVLIAVYVPRYGNTNVLVYVLICSLVGSLSVMSCKALGLGIRETIAGQANQLTNSMFWFLLLCVVVSVSIQMNYLNKALDVFETSLVTPIYYVFFTTFVLIASAILFKEWRTMQYQDMVGTVCGFLIVIIAVFLLNAFSDFDITFEVLRKHWIRQKAQKSASRNRLEDLEAGSVVDRSGSRDYLISSNLTIGHSGSKSLPGKKLKKTRKTSKRPNNQMLQQQQQLQQQHLRPQLLTTTDSESDI